MSPACPVPSRASPAHRRAAACPLRTSPTDICQEAMMICLIGRLARNASEFGKGTPAKSTAAASARLGGSVSLVGAACPGSVRASPCSPACPSSGPAPADLQGVSIRHSGSGLRAQLTIRPGAPAAAHRKPSAGQTHISGKSAEFERDQPTADRRQTITEFAHARRSPCSGAVVSDTISHQCAHRTADTFLAVYSRGLQCVA
jgi:hypothetical protein